VGKHRQNTSTEEAPAVALRYSLTELDMLAATALTPGARAMEVRWPVVAVLALAAALADWILREPDQLALAAAMGFGMAGLVFWVPARLRTSRVRRAFRVLGASAKNRTVRFFPSKLVVEDGDRNRVTFSWDEVSAARCGQNAIYLYAGERIVVLTARTSGNLEAAGRLVKSSLGPRFHSRPPIWSRATLVNTAIWCVALIAGAAYVAW
jgi:hypothetical protein